VSFPRRGPAISGDRWVALTKPHDVMRHNQTIPCAVALAIGNMRGTAEATLGDLSRQAGCRSAPKFGCRGAPKRRFALGGSSAFFRCDELCWSRALSASGLLFQLATE
jgi:hypothetical protein